jgi:hypothetical protein
MIDLMIIDIVRPKNVNLEKMFNIHLMVTLASDGCDVTKRIPITLGQTKVDFVIEAAAMVNQAIVYKENGEIFKAFWVSPKTEVISGMTATLTIHWNT